MKHVKSPGKESGVYHMCGERQKMLEMMHKVYYTKQSNEGFVNGGVRCKTRLQDGVANDYQTHMTSVGCRNFNSEWRAISRNLRLSRNVSYLPNSSLLAEMSHTSPHVSGAFSAPLSLHGSMITCLMFSRPLQLPPDP